MLLLNRQEELEFWRQLLLAVQPIREVDPADTAVGVDGHSQGFNVVGAVSPTREVGQVELDLVPALIQPHRHCADEGLHSSGGLVIGGPEPAPDILII